MKNFLPTIGLLLLIALVSACSEPTIVGSDLLAQDQIDVGYTDTFTLIPNIQETDSVRTFSPVFASQLIGYLVGEMDDPVFGRSLARINAEFLPGAADPDFTDAVLDSVVLVLPYFPFGQYGDTTENYGIEVYRLAETLEKDITYYSNQDVSVGNLIGMSELFMPRPNDSITIVSHGTDGETTQLPAQ